MLTSSLSVTLCEHSNRITMIIHIVPVASVGDGARGRARRVKTLLISFVYSRCMQSPVDYWHFSVAAVFEVKRPATTTTTTFTPSTSVVRRFIRSTDPTNAAVASPRRGSNSGANCAALREVMGRYRRRRSKSIRQPSRRSVSRTVLPSPLLSSFVFLVSTSPRSCQQLFGLLAEPTASWRARAAQQRRRLCRTVVELRPNWTRPGRRAGRTTLPRFRPYPLWDESSDIANE